MPTLTMSHHETMKESIQAHDPVPMPVASKGKDQAQNRVNLPLKEQKPPPKKRGRRRLLQNEDQRKARRKAQCKLNQRRYRARQRGLISMLSYETEGLSGYYRDLQEYRDFLRDYFVPPPTIFSVRKDPRPMLVANHFLRAFRTGFALHSIESSSLQESFIRLVCAPELMTQGATTYGIDALLLQLKRYASYHTSLEVRPVSVNMVHVPTQKLDTPANEENLSWIVETKGAISMRISRDTLMLVYPHVLRHHEALAQRVMGQTIEPEFTATLYFNTRAKVTKLEHHVDFAGAFLQLLKSAEDVATLLQDALISPFSELGLDPQGTTESALTRGCKQLSLQFILL